MHHFFKYPFYLFLVAFMLFPWNSKCQVPSLDKGLPIFQRLNNDNGLSQGTINAIAQDAFGFIWIGTNDGLNRYDGYEFLTFRNNPNDTAAISSNSITEILVGDDGMIWVGTVKGLNKFDPSTGIFSLITNAHLKYSTSVTSLAFGQNNTLWVGTKNSGLGRLNLSTNDYEAFNAGQNSKNLLPSSSILKLFVDSKNTLWIGLFEGDICYYNHQTKSFPVIEYDYPNQREKLLNQVTGITEDKHNNLWISTYGNSLLYLNTSTLTLEQLNKLRTIKNEIPYVLSSLYLKNDSLLYLGADMQGLILYNLNTGYYRSFEEGTGKHTISYRTVKTLFSDRDENLWVGTNGKGINILSPYHINFSTITQLSPKNMALRIASVRSILEENDSILWVGGYSGLQKINLNKKRTEEFYNIIPYTLCIDDADKNIMWIGTEGAGIFLLNKSSGELNNLPPWEELTSKNEVNLIAGGFIIYEIMNLDLQHMLIGTNMGLHVLDKTTLSYEFFNQFSHSQHSAVEVKVNTIFTDSKKRIWVGTMTGGLAEFRADKDSLLLCSVSNPDGANLSIDRINCIYEDCLGEFWMGTNLGLVHLDENMNLIRVYSERDGLPNNMIYGVLEDSEGKLWLSTNEGIAQFDPSTHKINKYNKNDGLPSNEFNGAAYFQRTTERLYFGGVDGLVFFNPQGIYSTPAPNRAVICEATIFDGQDLSDFTISYKNEIVLHPGQQILRLKFSALQYFGLQKSNFAFRLDTENSNWAQLGQDRNLTLSMSEPGEYILELTADNGYGKFTKNTTSYTITVEPEFYQTSWFKALMVIFIVSASLVIYLFRINMIKQQRNKLEQLVNKRTSQLKQTNQELESANEAKNKFLSIIAHDLRSPFNSMIGFNNILLDDWKILSDDEKVEIITIVKNTTEDTYQLLVNLLEWSRIQKEQLEYKPTRTNLLHLSEKCVKQIKADAFLKNIRITIEIKSDLYIFADENMLNTVCRNLISNAVKFTPKNGEVSIRAEEHDEKVECCICDTGIGMTKEEAENLFKLQYRNSSKGTEGETGTGLGLVLCHEFIKKHNGKFTVKSEPNKGSTFCFIIPNLAKTKQGFTIK